MMYNGRESIYLSGNLSDTQQATVMRVYLLGLGMHTCGVS